MDHKRVHTCVALEWLKRQYYQVPSENSILMSYFQVLIYKINIDHLGANTARRKIFAMPSGH